MKRFVRDHWIGIALVALVLGYLFLSGGLLGVWLAHFGHSAGDDAYFFLMGGAIFSVIRLLYPIRLSCVGPVFPLEPLPMVLGLVAVVVVFMVVLRGKVRSIVQAGLLAYMVAMLVTNDVGLASSIFLRALEPPEFEEGSGTFVPAESGSR